MDEYIIIKDADEIAFFCESSMISSVICDGSMKFYRDAICFIDNGLYCSMGLPRKFDDTTWEVRLMYQDCYQITDRDFYYPDNDAIDED